MSKETFSDRNLTLEVADDGQAIRVEWLGKSTARNPASFLAPVLQKALAQAAAAGRPLVLDFTRVAYMNSSTITPIIRLLDEAKRGGHAVTVLYRADLKWQALSFSALEIFETEDQRIAIRGVK
jgi:hypothetical protein